MRKPSAQPIGAFVADLVRPTLAARGLSEASLVSAWPEIVGDKIAAFARPEQLQWPPRGDKRDPEGPSAPATLVLRIDGAFALEASHLGPMIIARVNGHLGWRCVERLAFRQGPLAPLRSRSRKIAPPSAKALAEAESLTAEIADEGLRTALTRLGARVIDKAGGKA